jgi:hypothetical protein
MRRRPKGFELHLSLMIVTTSSIRRPIISKKKKNLQEKKEFLLHLSFIFGIVFCFFFNLIPFLSIIFVFIELFYFHNKKFDGLI